MEHGRAHPEATGEYVRAHAQEMDPLVCQQHIDLYVNDFTVDYGAEGEEAIRRLLEAAAGCAVGGVARRGRGAVGDWGVALDTGGLTPRLPEPRDLLGRLTADD